MKKLAALLLSATGAIAAHAQTTVTVYGNMDAALTLAKSGAGSTLPGGAGSSVRSSSVKRLDSGVGPGSRLGFRGREDLGGGLAASFVLEMGFGTDTGALQQGGLAFGRQAFVGLSGTNWSLTAGRQYSALDIAFASGDPTFGLWWGTPLGESGHGLYQSIGSVAGDGSFGASGRMDNAVQGAYTDGGLTAKLMVAAGNENSRGTGRYVAPAISYKADKFQIDASWSKMRETSAMIKANASPQWMTEAVVDASYDFGLLRAYLGAYQFKGPTNRVDFAPVMVLGNAAASPFAYTWDSTRTIWLGALVPFNSSRLMLNLSSVRFNYSDGTPTGKSLTIGATYEYSLSKRTSLYGSYGYANNNASARTPLLAAVSVVMPGGFGADSSAYSLGIRHQF